MSDLAFLPPAAPVALDKLVTLVATGERRTVAEDRSLSEDKGAARLIRGLAALDRAGPDELTAFLEGDDPLDLSGTRAGACFVAREHLGNVPPETIALVTARPSEAIGRALALFYPAGLASAGPAFERRGIDPAAIVHADARLEQDVTIEAGAVVGPRVEVGSGTTIGANVVIGAGVRIGRGCVVEPQANIRAALIGDRVVVQSGARIGLDTKRDTRLGRVIVQDDVEIGANAVIERGRLGDTMIGDGARVGALTVVAADALVERQTIFDNRAGGRR